MMRECYIELGSNDDTDRVLLSAQNDLLACFPNATFSRLVRTEALGMDSPHMFYNRTARCLTSFPAEQIRARLKAIELAHGRKARDKAAGIVRIDLDLIYYDGTVLKPDDWQRPYVREGVAELGGVSAGAHNGDTSDASH